ncbi:MAG: DUF1552 domain-containing protein [Planctomycetota bacterium]
MSKFNSQSTRSGRRRFLRGTGVSIGLPWMASHRRSIAADSRQKVTTGDDGPPHRMIAICNNLGLHAPHFNPVGQGMNWKPSMYLKEFEPFRDSMTVLTGVSHPEVDGGHNAEKSFLTTAPHPASGSFRNTISLDQFAAAELGKETRFPYLALGVNTSRSLSWTRSGVPIPAEQRPSKVFERLFIEGSAADKGQRIESLRQGQSVMDSVRRESRLIHRELDREDREKFEEYLQSVREVEKNLQRQQAWSKTPKPEVEYKQPKDIRSQADVIGKCGVMYDLMHLAIVNDSTRFITLLSAGHFIVPPIEGVAEGYHTLSHHGQNPDKIAQLALIELEEMKLLASLVKRLKRSPEAGGSLLDRTMVLYGSNMGNASSHDNRNLPTMLFGGQFNHGQHLQFDSTNNESLANLYVSMLQRLGLPVDQFGTTGLSTMRGLALKG